MLSKNESAKNPVIVVDNIVQSKYYSYNIEQINSKLDSLHEWLSLPEVQLAIFRFISMAIAMQNEREIEDLKLEKVCFPMNLLGELLDLFEPKK